MGCKKSKVAPPPPKVEEKIPERPIPAPVEEVKMEIIPELEPPQVVPKQEIPTQLQLVVGHLLSADVMGQIVVKCHLSGQPECKFGMNEKLAIPSGGSTHHPRGSPGSPYPGAVALDDVRFHQCVRISRFEADRAITFIPPDGTFELMTIKRLVGQTEVTLTADVELVASVKETVWVRPPIELDFQVPMFTASGLTVRFLRVYVSQKLTMS
ncbi:AP-2 complex subunit mu-like [Condylostylus longicornis]|uniref:AP-2 complex subunit mu-like n=1 Tax=Condylostylus longicornis TaxID=2530218 RepID=UPI00244E3FAB|nr:AP-2 complex subunit mu-like [Condylostylus longicornis]